MYISPYSTQSSTVWLSRGPSSSFFPNRKDLPSILKEQLAHVHANYRWFDEDSILSSANVSRGRENKLRICQFCSSSFGNDPSPPYRQTPPLKKSKSKYVYPYPLSTQRAGNNNRPPSPKVKSVDRQPYPWGNVMACLEFRNDELGACFKHEQMCVGVSGENATPLQVALQRKYNSRPLLTKDYTLRVRSFETH